jgi:predicted neuraminidase
MLEGLIVGLGEKSAAMFTRTSEGHVWVLRSEDDGRSWSDPRPTPLIHPDAPPMIFPLRRKPGGGASELIALIHNRPAGHAWKIVGRDRQDLWCCRSTDGGRTWTEPRFVMADAAESPRGRKEVSYCDLLVDGDVLHLLLDHQKRQILHVRFTLSDLEKLPTKAEITSGE